MRRGIWICLALLASVQVAIADITSNLYGRWSFDNDTYGSATVNDDSGNGRHGTRAGYSEPTWGKGFHAGQARHFNYENIYTYPASHSTTNNDYVSMAGIHGALDGSYTISAHLAYTMLPPGTGSDNDAGYVLAFWSDGGNVTGLSIDNLGHFIAFHTVSNGTRYTATSSNTFTQAKRWYHVAQVVNVSSGTVTLYVDGISEGVVSFPPNSTAWDYSNASFYLGINYPGASTYRWALAGRLDDVRIYNRALSQSDVREFIGTAAPYATGPGNGAYQSGRYSVGVRSTPYSGSFNATYTYTVGETSETRWGDYGNTATNVHFASVESTGGALVEVTLTGGSVTTIDVAPHSAHAVSYIQSGKGYVFIPTQLGKLWVTINGVDTEPLMLWNNVPWEGCPGGSTTYGPGVHSPGTIVPSNNEIICLEPGAWVKGNVDVRGKSNVAVIGRGVLSGEDYDGYTIRATSWPNWANTWLFSAVGSSNATIRDVILTYAPTYHIFGNRWTYNIKAVTPWRYNTDGVRSDIVNETFLFVGDAGFSTSHANEWCNEEAKYVVNSWGATTNNALFVGGYKGAPHSCHGKIQWVENIDLKAIGNGPGSPTDTPVLAVIWVDKGDQGSGNTYGFANQVYNGIRVEGDDDGGPLISLKMKDYPWEADNSLPPYGHMHDIWFRDVVVEFSPAFISEVKGYDSSNEINDWYAIGWVVNGTPVTAGNYSSYFAINAYSHGTIY